MYSVTQFISVPVTKTVDELRNEIRQGVGRHERIESTAFTKEALAAICNEIGYEIDTAGRLPSKARMRAGILWTVGIIESDEPALSDRPFRKDELRQILAALDPA